MDSTRGDEGGLKRASKRGPGEFGIRAFAIALRLFGQTAPGCNARRSTTPEGSSCSWIHGRGFRDSLWALGVRNIPLPLTHHHSLYHHNWALRFRVAGRPPLDEARMAEDFGAVGGTVAVGAAGVARNTPKRVHLRAHLLRH
eukprot:1183196-Prorocentrum_minimum.AAC.2